MMKQYGLFDGPVRLAGAKICVAFLSAHGRKQMIKAEGCLWMTLFVIVRLTTNQR